MKDKEREKSLCESCSNRVVIKFHGKNIRSGVSELDCFYVFTVETSDSRYKENTNGASECTTHVAHVIVDECTFYNKSLSYIKRRKVKEDDNSDSDDGKRDDKFENGVTITNISGALLP